MKLILVNKDDVPVKIGDTVTDFRGDSTTLVGWAPPYHPQDNLYRGAKVFVKDKPIDTESEYYPSVFDLHFKLILDTDPLANHPSATEVKA